MGILGTLAFKLLKPKLKKFYTEVYDIAKKDPELQKALEEYSSKFFKLRVDLIKESFCKRHPEDIRCKGSDYQETLDRIAYYRKILVKDAKAIGLPFHESIETGELLDKFLLFEESIKNLDNIGVIGLDVLIEEFQKQNKDSEIIFDKQYLKNYKSDKSNLKENQLNIELAIDIINNRLQWDNVILFLAPYFIFTKNRLYIIKSGLKGLKDEVILNYFKNFESIKFDKFKKKDKAYSFSKELFLACSAIGLIFGWIGWGLYSSFYGLLIGALIGTLLGFNFDRQGKFNYKETGKKTYKSFFLKNSSYTNSAIDLFNKLSPDLIKILEINKEESIKALEEKKKDHDGDGDIDSDDYFTARDKNIKKSMGKKLN